MVSELERLKNFGDFKRPVSSKYLTSCTYCRKGIFIGQDKVWTKDGLIHEDCRL